MPKMLIRGFAISLLISLIAAFAGAQSFVPIPNSAQEMYISANGLTIAGNEGLNQLGNGAWLWDTGTQQFWSDQVSNVYVLSGNGLAAGGDFDSNSITFYYPFGGSPYQPGIVPQAMSTDGQTVYGFTGPGQADYVWSPTNGGTQIYTTSNEQYPWACSGDGTTLYGYTTSSSPDEAWIWTQATGATSIGAFRPYACSLDGQNVVGVDSTSGDGNTIELVNITSGLSTLVLPGNAYSVGDMPVSITADGSTVWGTYEDSNSRTHAFLWISGVFTDLGANTAFITERNQHGSNRFPGYWTDSKGNNYYGYYDLGIMEWVDLADALTSSGQNLSGWSNVKVMAIDDDGTEMCGYGNSPNGSEAFYAQVPDDLLNVTNFFPSTYSFYGGDSATVNVQISEPPGAGGQALTVASNSPDAQVPATVTIPEGLTTASFKVTSSYVSTAETVTVSATLNSNPVQIQLTLNPVPIGLFYVRPTAIYGGKGCAAVIELAGKAGPSGDVISLSSDSSAVVLPASVTIPAGQSLINFAFTSQNVFFTSQVGLTATLGSSSQTTLLTVAAPLVKSFYTTPTTLQGGTSSTGYIVLASPALSQGAVFSILSSSSYVGAPSSVTVPAGQTTMPFTITTKAVPAPIQVSITAISGFFHYSATVTLTPLDFQNSGFETPAITANSWQEPPPAGTTWTGGSGFGLANGANSLGTGAEAGSQYAFLQSANSPTAFVEGVCQQTVSGFVVGKSYAVTFYMASGKNFKGAPVELVTNGTVIFPAAAPPTGGAWTKYTSNIFTATSTSYTFDFVTSSPPTNTNRMTLLDEVHLVPMP